MKSTTFIPSTWHYVASLHQLQTSTFFSVHMYSHGWLLSHCRCGYLTRLLKVRRAAISNSSVGLLVINDEELLWFGYGAYL